MTRVIGITGYAQHGKNTAAEVLAEAFGNARIIGLADALRKFVTLQNPIVGSWGTPPEQLRYATAVEQFGYEGAKRGSEVRRLLQATGTEAARTIFGDDCWINALEYEIEQDTEHATFIVPDVRFSNEVRWVRRVGNLLGVIRHDGKDSLFDSGVSRTHASEAYIPGALDLAAAVFYASNVSDLREQANAWAQQALSSGRIFSRG